MESRASSGRWTLNIGSENSLSNTGRGRIFNEDGCWTTERKTYKTLKIFCCILFVKILTEGLKFDMPRCSFRRCSAILINWAGSSWTSSCCGWAGRCSIERQTTELTSQGIRGRRVITLTSHMLGTFTSSEITLSQVSAKNNWTEQSIEPRWRIL